MEDGRVLRVKFKPGVSADKRFKGVVRILTDLIEDGMRDDAVRLKAVQILNEAGVKGHDEIGELKAITKWVQNNAVYRKDPFGVEFFFTARRQIRDIEKGIHSGDCDDFVILGGALLGSLGYPVGALIVDSNNDGTFNHVMLVTKTFSPTRQFKNDWIPIELIYPQFRLGESVPISKVYPLMAHVDTIRAPVTSKIISGIKGLMGAHPIGQIAGMGSRAKNKVYDMGDAEDYGNYTGNETTMTASYDSVNHRLYRDPDATSHVIYNFGKKKGTGIIKGIAGRKIKVEITSARVNNSIGQTYPVSLTLATKWQSKKIFGRVYGKTPKGRVIRGKAITVILSSASDYINIKKNMITVKVGSNVYKSSGYDKNGYSIAQTFSLNLLTNTATSLRGIDDAVDPIVDYLGAMTASEDEYF